MCLGVNEEIYEWLAVCNSTSYALHCMCVVFFLSLAEESSQLYAFKRTCKCSVFFSFHFLLFSKPVEIKCVFLCIVFSYCVRIWPIIMNPFKCGSTDFFFIFFFCLIFMIFEEICRPFWVVWAAYARTDQPFKSSTRCMICFCS